MKIKLKDFKVFTSALLLAENEDFWNQKYIDINLIGEYDYTIPQILKKFIALNQYKFTNEEYTTLVNLVQGQPETKNKSNYIIAFHIIDAKPEE